MQLGILSVYGNILELVDLDTELQGAVVGAFGLAREDADRSLLEGLSAAQAATESRLAAARARNRHLNRSYERERVGRRRRRGMVA